MQQSPLQPGPPLQNRPSPLPLTGTNSIPEGLNGQPLSPTQTSSNRQSSRILRPDTSKQKSLKGTPQMIGLASLEYLPVVHPGQVSVKELSAADLQRNYLKDIYEDSENPFKGDQFFPSGNQFVKAEVQINLPFDMCIEQIEMQVANFELYNKYLKVLKVETTHTDRNVLHLRGGYFDHQKNLLELNACGVAQPTIKVVFLYNLSQRPNGGNFQPLKAPRGEHQSRSQNAHQQLNDKIKNEIIPLLNLEGGLNDDNDSMDELDDEVAMISNKKSQDDIISSEDIKIEVKAPLTEQSRRIGQIPRQPSHNDPSADNRNFNTLPRNYSESQAREELKCQEQLLNLEQEIFTEQSERAAQPHLVGEVTKLIQKSIASFKVVGFNSNTIPAITVMSHFMNNSFLLKKEGHLTEALEQDFIIGVLLISNKRTIQAVETFRKIQAHNLQVIDARQREAKNTPQQKIEINKLYVRCAIIELLTAESMNTALQINEKLWSMRRMCELFQGRSVPIQTFLPQIHFIDDPYTTILRLLPVLLKFVLMCVTHKREIVRISSMKLLEFILETKGCSLDSSMVYILKAILATYPGTPQPQKTGEAPPPGNQGGDHTGNEQGKPMHPQDSFCIGHLSRSVQEYFQYHHPQQKRPSQEIKVDLNDTPTELRSIKEPNSGFITALKNAYNHVLETYVSVLSSISSHILHQLFYEVIIPTLTQAAPSIDVKIFAIKIADKIITICQGDLVLSRASLDYFLVTVAQKLPPSATADQQLYATNLRNLWQSIRTKVFANYSQKGLKTLIEWLVQRLTAIAQSAGENSKDYIGGNAPNRLENEPMMEESNADISKMEISEEESSQLLQVFDIISVVSVSRKKNEEEANSQIKIKQDYILELYLLINPLLFWLDFSVEREERFPLFKSVYQTIKEVLENLPPKRVDIDLLQIMIPILQKTTEYLKSNSPSQSMLKFLEIVLRDIKAGGYCQMQSDLQYFFLELLRNFVGYISYCLYDEVFSVFDKLFAMCADVINERVLTKCIAALVDKYTMKSKPHKASLAQFMKVLMEVKIRQRGHHARPNNNHAEEDELDGGAVLDDDQISVHSKNNYFEIMCNFCFFYNEDPSGGGKGAQLDHFRSPTDHHDLYIDKLQFFIESLSLLNEMHVNMFTSMVMNPRFKANLQGLLQKGELALRLKCHEILEVVTSYNAQYCLQKNTISLPGSASAQQRVGSAELQRRKPASHEVMEVDFISLERLYLSQIVVQCVRTSLESKQDSYLQFNSLISLDFLFQNLLPVPSFQNELMKEQLNAKDKKSSSSNQNQSINQVNGRQPSSDQVLDIETMEINENTPEFDVTQRQYMLMRLNLIFKLWPYVQQALNSAWSNIRSICYGLICSMLKIDIRDFQSPQGAQPNPVNQQFLVKLKNIVLPMLMNLLSSKESESKAGGLNILGSFCGLSYDFSQVKISKSLDFFRKNSQFISLSIWQLVFDLQDDWDITIKEASVVLIQLCAPRDAVKYFDKVKWERENIKFSNMLNKYAVGANGDQSSRLSSSRGGMDAQMQFLNSANSMNGENEDYLSGIPQTAKDKAGNNILSFLSGTADDMSLVLQMEQHNQQQQVQPPNPALSASAEMLDHIAGPTGLPIKRNDRKIASGVSSASDGGAGLQEEVKRNNYLGELDDALQYQEIMENDTGASTHFVFFVDKYSDDQIQEIISIFRNDFKPPKNLWIEKNPSAAFNSPDYYAEIFSQAIDQYNQQQMLLQQKQNNEMQMQLNNSPKVKNPMVDALEDDMVKRYENEKKEKERLQMQNKPKEVAENNFMIFERHFEDKQEPPPPPVVVTLENSSAAAVSQAMNELIREEDIAMKKEELSVPSSNNQSEVCSIDAEPFQFLDSPKVVVVADNKPPKKEESTIRAANNQQQNIQVLDEEIQPKSAKGPSKDKPLNIITQPPLSQPKPVPPAKQEPTNNRKKTTDELIEEYERKINNTKSLLEEEKKRVAKRTDEVPQTDQTSSQIPHQEQLSKNLTPEFKGKQPLQETDKAKNKPALPPPQLMQTHQLQSYLTEFSSKGYLSGQDNAKLLKQIKNCFNEHITGLGTLSTTPQGGVSKCKQKLNKSYENLLAANKGKTPTDVITAKALLAKKNLSTSPRRGSSSGKKSGSSRGGGITSKKKYLQMMVVQDQANQGKNKTATMYNMRDLNFFIKKIEKDITDKFKSGNSTTNAKDFNSMPTTPTSILKKVEEQMKALAMSKDLKAQMSNTCPNMAQVLSSLDSNASKSVGPKNHHGNETARPMMAGGSALLPLNGIQVGANFQTLNSSSLLGQSHNSLSHYPGSAMSYQTATQGDKFSKTQKLDLKDASKGIFNYSIPVRDGITYREEHSNENRTQKSLSPFKDEKQVFANLLKQSKHHKKSGKRSRGSTDKYLLGNGGHAAIANPASTAMATGQVNYTSSSSSYGKLNKSANNIQGGSSGNVGLVPLTSTRKKEQGPPSSLSQQLINSLAKANNMSPNNKKLLKQMVKHQFIQPPPQSAGLPLSLSAQNKSITHDMGDLSKRGQQQQKILREKSPKKINTSRRDNPPRALQLDNLDMSSPINSMPPDEVRHSAVGLKNALKQISHK